MADKSYLKNQIRLISLSANDLFTDDEHEVFMEVCALINEIDKLDKTKHDATAAQRKQLISQRKEKSKQLTQMIKNHDDSPRKVRLKSVLKQEKDISILPGATWKKMKFSKKICEFESEMSRAMGLHHLDHTFDKVIIKWGDGKEDVLRQLVLNGFIFEILQDDGSVEERKYRCFTASAGQLRRDKVQFISENIWQKIKPRLECGLDWDKLNEQGGINVN